MASNPIKIKVLRRTSDFDKIRESGRRLSPSRWITIGFKKNQLEYSRYGWTVSRKVGSAVIRNKLKRWCRVYFRSVDGSLSHCLDINVVFKPVNSEFYKTLKYSDFVITVEKGWDNLSKLD